MKRAGLPRGVRVLVLVASIVGVVTAGIATQASATPPASPVLIGTGTAQNSANKTVNADLSAGAIVGEVVVASVATGTFQGAATCTDDASGGPNTYHTVADRNGGSGRLFVCVSEVTHTLTSANTVTANYPQFSGASVIQVVKFDFSTNGTVTPADVSTNSGSNPAVSSGKICEGPSGHWLFGVVANGNISDFAVDSPPWTHLATNSVASGAGKRTLTSSYENVFGACPVNQYELTGHLQNPGSGFWQAAIVGLSRS